MNRPESSRPRLGRRRRDRVAPLAEALEDRRLMTVSITPLTFNPTEGSAFSGNVATFTSNDPPVQDVANYTATIDWGDGTSDAGSVAVDGVVPGRFDVSGSHVYGISGTFIPTIHVADAVDSTTPSATGTAVVANVGPSGLVLSIDPSPVEGRASTLSGSFTDPGATDTFTATVDWGDGSTPQIVAIPAGSKSFALDHAYREEGAYAPGVVVRDAGSATTNASLPIVVADAALAVTSIPFHATEGANFSGEVATFTDANPAVDQADLAATILWGDGQSSAGTITRDASGVYHVSGSHVFDEEGSFPTTVLVADAGGSQATNASVSQTNLVSDGAVPALHVDPNLVNPWGIASSPTGPFWVSDNKTGVSTLYNGAGNILPLVVTIPPPPGSPSGTLASPTGIVFNGTPDFGVTGGPSHFLFDTEDGTISGWNSGVTAELQVDNSASGAVYKGLATGANGGSNFLYAANFHSGMVEVYNASFVQTGAFTDPNVPAGYAPFGIQNIGGSLYVTFAQQDGSAHDDVAGPGHGYVDVFSTAGVLQRRLISGGALNSPWGLALAPSNFGSFSNDLLVGNFGDGTINAFDPATGALIGPLVDGANRPIVNEGLWGLAFGNGANAGPSNTLFFTAGVPGVDGAVESHGLFGSLAAPVNAASVADAPLSVQVGPIATVEATRFFFFGMLDGFTGAVAVFTDSDPNGAVGDYTATINWGDGQSSSGTIFLIGKTPNGVAFSVDGSHAYAEEGNYTVNVVVDDAGGSTAVANGLATVSDAPLIASPVAVSGVEGQPLSRQFFPTLETSRTIVAVADFSDPRANESGLAYAVVIHWGDGSPDTAGEVGPRFLDDIAFPTNFHTVFGSHTYAESGTYPIDVVIRDQGGSTAHVVSTATIADVPISLNGDLNPASDSGASHSDKITNVNQPNFFGTSEPFSTIQLFAQRTDQALPTVVGTTTTDASGAWSITTTLLADGAYSIVAKATDQAGVTTATSTIVPVNSGLLVIDTVGPKVGGFGFNRATGRVVVTFQDERSGLDGAQVINGANYIVTKPHVKLGNVLVTRIDAGTPTFSASGASTQVATLTLNNGRRIRGGSFYFTILSGGIVDLAGNKLDGEFYGYLPSGNNLPGGDFRARVDAFHNLVFPLRPLYSSASPLTPPGTTTTGQVTGPGSATRPFAANRPLPRDVVQNAVARHLRAKARHDAHDAAVAEWVAAHPRKLHAKGHRRG